MAVLEFENVTKNYGKVTAVRNMSFKTEDGEFLVILGPSGAGKTTTLKISCGLVNPTEGNVFLDGENITKVPPYKRNISMTFENYSLYPHMTVFDNMAYPLRANRGEFNEEEIKNRVVEIAKMLHIEELLDRFPAEASGGQKQRIALGRTMVRRPKIYLLDEPLAHLDAKIRVELREEFHRLEALKQATTIYVTHDYTEALSLGDRIMIINKGVVQQLDNPKKIFYEPANLEVARQVGQPAINMITSNIRRENGQVFLIPIDDPGIKLSVNEKQSKILENYSKEKVILGIRPQDVSIEKSRGDIELEAIVDVFQPLGSDGVLTTKVGALQIIGLIPPESDVRHNQKVKIFFNPNNYYLFDFETKENISLKFH